MRVFLYIIFNSKNCAIICNDVRTEVNIRVDSIPVKNKGSEKSNDLLLLKNMKHCNLCKKNFYIKLNDEQNEQNNLD